MIKQWGIILMIKGALYGIQMLIRNLLIILVLRMIGVKNGLKKDIPPKEYRK